MCEAHRKVWARAEYSKRARFRLLYSLIIFVSYRSYKPRCILRSRLACKNCYFSRWQQEERGILTRSISHTGNVPKDIADRSGSHPPQMFRTSGGTVGMPSVVPSGHEYKRVSSLLSLSAPGSPAATNVAVHCMTLTLMRERNEGFW